MAAHHQRSHNYFWLISVPGSGSYDALFHRIGERGTKLADVYRFEIPLVLRVGGLDDLMLLSDDIEKMEMTCASTTRKVGAALINCVRENQKDAPVDQLLQVQGRKLDFYLQNFTWDAAKFTPSKSCREIANMICSEVEEVDQRFRDLMIKYTDANTRLNSAERSQKSNLTVRDLSDIVQESDLPAMTSQLFTTVLAVVPNFQTQAWEREYTSGFGSQLLYNPDNKDQAYKVKPHFKFDIPKDTPPEDIPRLTQEAEQRWERELTGPRGYFMSAVIPDSSRLLSSDSEFSLYTVTVFRACLKDFAARAREARYTIREYTPPAAGAVAGEKLVVDLRAKREEQKQLLITFCKDWFKESFVAWIHLKALRIFVQSLLRYGIPPDFQAILIAPHSPGENSKLRLALADQYKHLTSDEDTSIAPGGLSTQKIYPYVFTEIDLHMG